MGAGVGATWPAASGDPVPAPEASWRAWLAWMGGDFRFQGSHGDALRMYTARTGRDLAGELREGWPPENDSARAVIGTILRGLGALAEPSPDELAGEFRSGAGPRVWLARQELRALLPAGRVGGVTPDSLLAPDDLVAEVVPPLLDSLLAQGSSPWPGGAPDGTIAPTAGLYMGGFHGVRDVPFFLVDENLPTGFTPDPGSGFKVIGEADWEARPSRAGGVVMRVAPLTAVGPFAALRWDWTAMQRRAEDEAPSGYAGGGVAWLLRTDEGWVVVMTTGYIT